MIGTLFGSMLVFLVLGVPIAVTLGMASVVTITQISSVSFTAMITKMFSGVDSFPIMAVPLFLLAGNLMDAGGISTSLVKFANELVGHIKAGLAMVAVLASMLFAGISGSGAADTAAVGSILIPAMRKQGYEDRFSTALVAAAGAIGPVIPPSSIMVVLGVCCSISVGGLFVGGVVPGLLIGLALMILAQFFVRSGRVPIEEPKTKFSFVSLFKAFLQALPALGAPIIIMGGILGGIFTATEAASVCVFYSLIVGMFFYKQLTWKGAWKCTVDAVSSTAMVLLIIATASSFAWIISVANLPTAIANGIMGFASAKWVFLLCINILFLIVGGFMESIAATLVLCPVLLPVAIAFGVEPMHFGIIIAVNLAIGMVTPPYGITLFTACTVSGRTVKEVTPFVLPMVGAMIAVLLLITYCPKVALFLPHLFGYV